MAEKESFGTVDNISKINSCESAANMTTVLSDELVLSLLTEHSNEPRTYVKETQTIVNPLEIDSSSDNALSFKGLVCCKSPETFLNDHDDTAINTEQVESPNVKEDISDLEVENASCIKDFSGDKINSGFLNSDSNSVPGKRLVENIKNPYVIPANDPSSEMLHNQESSLSEPVIEECVHKAKDAEMQNYRCESDSWSDDDSSSNFTFDSSSECSDSFLDKMHMNSLPPKVIPVKTKGELQLDDLPPIEELHITLLAREMKKVGTVYAIVDKLVIVRALRDLCPLDLDSVLFLSSEKPLGRIFDVFGPVVEPFYSIRFNSPQHIIEREVSVDANVFFAPRKRDITSYVFVDQLRNEKGSDASWKDNNEPPEEHLDYSDDEQERSAKRKRRAKDRKCISAEDDVQIIPTKISNPVEKQDKDIPTSSVWKDKPKFNSSSQPVSTPSYENPFRTPYSSSSYNRNSTTSYSYMKPSLATVMSSRYVPSSYQAQNAAAVTSQSLVSRNAPQSFVSQPHFVASQQRGILCPPSPLLPPPRTVILSQPQGPRTYRAASFLPATQALLTGIQMPLQPPSPISLHSTQPFMSRQSLNMVSNQRPFQSSQTAVPCTQVLPVYQQHHSFGQISSMRPLPLQSPIAIPSPVLSPAPSLFAAVSFAPPSSQGGYFNPNFVNSTSNPVSIQAPTDAHWHQGRLTIPPPRMGMVPPNAPLSVNIPSSPAPLSPAPAYIPPSHGLLNVVDPSHNLLQNRYQSNFR